jgi:hypothetical protein
MMRKIRDLGRIMRWRIVRLKQIINFLSLLLLIRLLLIILFLEIISFIVFIPWVTSIMIGLIIAHVLPLILIKLLYLFDSIPSLSTIIHLLYVKVLFFMLIRFRWPLFEIQSFLGYRLLMPLLWVVHCCLWPHVSNCWLSTWGIWMWNSCIRGSWKGPESIFEGGGRTQKLKFEIPKLGRKGCLL